MKHTEIRKTRFKDVVEKRMMKKKFEVKRVFS